MKRSTPENPSRVPFRWTIALTALLCVLFTAAPPAWAARPWVGIALGNASGGVQVTRVLPTSPADQAGLRAGDLVTQVSGVSVTTPRSLLAITSKARIGQTLTITLTRGGQTHTKRLRIGTVPKLRTLIRLFLLNTKAPNFTTPLVNRAGSLSLSSLRGKAVILYFWASWCDSCKLNMPKLKRLHGAYAKRGLVIYSMGQDKRLATLKKTTASLNLPFVVGWNQRNHVGLLYKSKNIPVLVGIDKNGIIREYTQGSSYGYGRLDRLARKLLK